MSNPFRGFRAILYKEFIVVFRDPMTLFFMLVPPMIQMIAFGYALDNDVKHIATVVLNEDRTLDSRRLIEELVNTETFRVVAEVASVEEMAEALRRGRARVGVQVPPDFARDLRAGRTAQVQLLIDGSNSTVASQALNTAFGLTLRKSLLMLLKETERSRAPIEVRPQMLYNPEMRSPNFFVPGVIGVVLQIATTFATAMSIVRERERGTLEQLLVSPVSRWGLMFGKLLPYLCISSTMALFLFVGMRYLFLVPIRGSYSALLASSLVYIFALLSLGLLISTRAANQMQALQMTITLMLPSVFFSGFIFPRESMPWIFYALGAALPATYYIELLRAIVLRGASAAEFGLNLGVLAGMGTGLFVLCAIRFRKRIG